MSSVPVHQELETVRAKMFSALDAQGTDIGWERVLNRALATLIAANMIAVILESVDEIYMAAPLAFHVFEALSVTVFAVEYVLRVWSCTADPQYVGIRGRLRFVTRPLAIVDLISILPSLLPGGTVDLRFSRAFRMLRLTRALKLARYSRSLQAVFRVIATKREELTVSGFIGGVLLLVAASAMYFAEHAAQPDKFASIPAAMWWAAVTLTTIGYGDVVPITPVGKVVASVIAVLGIAMFALPAGILASGFAEELKRAKGGEKCPHCGKEL